MAQQQNANPREVERITTEIRTGGMDKAKSRFDERTPEFQKAVQDAAKRQAITRAHRKATQKAAQEATQSRRTPGQQRVAEMHQRQAAQDRTIRKRDAQAQSQGQAM